MPQALSHIIQRLDEIEKKVDFLKTTRQEEPAEKWFDLEALCAYLPQHPAKQTVYGWTSANLIPYHKNGKSIIFRKTEIDEWLQQGAVKSQQMIEAEARAYVDSTRQKGGYRR